MADPERSWCGSSILSPTTRRGSARRSIATRSGAGRSGVRRHRVLRRGDGPSLVAVELEFGDRAAAESFASALHEMWGRVRDRFEWRELPEAQIFELTEAEEY